MLGEFISQRHCGELAEAARRQSHRWLQFDPATLQAAYNRQPFLLSHRLAEHPLMEMPALGALCRRLPRQQVALRVGRVPGDTDFDASYLHYRNELTLDDAIDRLEERGAYICVNNPERDPAYRPLLQALLGEVALQTAPLDPGITWYSTYLFISARDAVTPYHMDREMNFLLQVRGRKQVLLWDPDDDEVMTAAQKELLLAYVGERPAYKPAIEAKARRFELRPGLGVHHPFIAPHRVHTESDVSVSLAFTFRTRRSDTWTQASQLNRKLRQLGLDPGPFGRHAALDSAKAGLMRTLRLTRQLVRRPQTATA